MAWTGDPPCQVRFTERDGRWVLTGLRVESDDRLDTNLVRKIPLGRLEELYNVEGSFSPVISGSGDGGARPMPRPRVRVPQGRDYGDDFYAEVAAVYQALLAMGEPPATTIAQDTGVPITTANRWIRECRLRDLLPPARRGRIT